MRRGHPNDKLRTEHSFREVERSFLNGREFRDLDDIRTQLANWLDRTVDHRRLDKRTALECFAEDRDHLVLRRFADELTLNRSGPWLWSRRSCAISFLARLWCGFDRAQPQAVVTMMAGGTTGGARHAWSPESNAPTTRARSMVRSVRMVSLRSTSFWGDFFMVPR